jgi:two-component system, cell cycle sensor histidine kinase and response regulator CckA
MVRPLRVLLIEDNSDDERLLYMELRRSGFDPQVTRVETREEMAAALGRSTFDLILSDYRLPRFGAAEAVKLYAEMGLDTPFLVCSGSIGEAQAVDLLKQGASDFFLKDNLTRLGPTIERELREAENRRARRGAEAALHRSEQRFREIVEASPSGILLTDSDGFIRLVNPAIESLFGYGETELLGQRVELLVPDELRARHSDERRAFVKQTEFRRLGGGRELTARRKDGTTFPAEIGLNPFDSPDGRVVLATVVDVSERRRAAAQARALEERFQALVENSSDGIALVDRRGQVLYTSPAVSRILGYLAAELQGKEIFAFVHADDLAYARRRFEEALVSQAAPLVEEIRCRHQDGSLRFIEVVRVNRLEDASVQAVVLNLRDITERKAAERQLLESEEQYRLLFDSNPFPMWTFDLETLAFLQVNSAAVAHYGWSREEFLALTIADIRPKETLATLREDIESVRAGLGSASSGLWRHRKKDGTEIDVEVAASAIRFHGRPARLVLAADVSEKKVLERQLAQAQKMEAIGRLTGGVAHDFNNLLSVISGYAELAQVQLPGDHPAQARLEEIGKAADRASELTRQLLAFSRRQVLRPRPVDLNLLVKNVRAMLERMVGEDVLFLTHLDAALDTVMIDPTQMEQVLMNLAVNARQAMPTGGTLTMETANVDLDEDYIRRHAPVPNLPTGPYVMLSVADTGVGMDDATQARIFEPFFTTKGEGEGTGLGLATVYGIVKQSEGFIWVYSEPGHGSVFRIYLPRVAEAARPLPDERSTPKGTGGTETILVVEDQESLRQMIQEILEEQGYRVLAAADGHAALEHVRTHGGPLDLVLTDVVMPRMNGRELGDRVAALRPGIRLLFMSGYSNASVAERGLLDAKADLLQKPFGGARLREAVRQALDKP